MFTKNEDLHGSAPDSSKVALLIIDMINDFNFEDGDQLLNNSLQICENIHALKQNAKKLNIPVLYVNDNFGKWKSDFKLLVKHCIGENSKGKKITQLLHPDDEDYVVLKPKHSGFFSTTLDVLLKYLQTERLILTGITTDICVFFTANDAYMRDFQLFVPSDCVAAVHEHQHKNALENIQRILKADISVFSNIDLTKLKL